MLYMSILKRLSPFIIYPLLLCFLTTSTAFGNIQLDSDTISAKRKIMDQQFLEELQQVEERIRAGDISVKDAVIAIRGEHVQAASLGEVDFDLNSVIDLSKHRDRVDFLDNFGQGFLSAYRRLSIKFPEHSPSQVLKDLESEGYPTSDWYRGIETMSYLIYGESLSQEALGERLWETRNDPQTKYFLDGGSAAFVAIKTQLMDGPTFLFSRLLRHYRRITGLLRKIIEQKRTPPQRDPELEFELLKRALNMALGNYPTRSEGASLGKMEESGEPLIDFFPYEMKSPNPSTPYQNTWPQTEIRKDLSKRNLLYQMGYERGDTLSKDKQTERTVGVKDKVQVFLDTLTRNKPAINLGERGVRIFARGSYFWSRTSVDDVEIVMLVDGEFTPQTIEMSAGSATGHFPELKDTKSKIQIRVTGVENFRRALSRKAENDLDRWHQQKSIELHFEGIQIAGEPLDFTPASDQLMTEKHHDDIQTMTGMVNEAKKRADGWHVRQRGQQADEEAQRAREADLEQTQDRIGQEVKFSAGQIMAKNLLHYRKKLNIDLRISLLSQAQHQVKLGNYLTVKIRSIFKHVSEAQRLFETVSAPFEGPGRDILRATVARIDGPPPPMTNRDIQGDMLVANGKYMILNRLGQGGMGEVFKAIKIDDMKAGRRNKFVAIKMMRQGVTADLARRFLDEARVTKGLEHPNIVTVHEWGTDEDHTPYFVMEFMEGSLMDDYFEPPPDDPERRADQKEIANYIAQVAHALHYSHERGVVHRDVKPSNILLLSKDSKPKIFDFGILRDLFDEDTRQTQTRQVMGSLPFLDPVIFDNYLNRYGERVDGQRVKIMDKADHQSDIYSLGVTLFRLVTGELPYEASLHGRTHFNNAMRPKSLRSLRKDINPNLEAIILKAMAFDKKNRYRTMEALAADLKRFKEGEMSLAYVESARFSMSTIQFVAWFPILFSILMAPLYLLTFFGLIPWGVSLQMEILNAMPPIFLAIPLAIGMGSLFFFQVSIKQKFGLEGNIIQVVNHVLKRFRNFKKEKLEADQELVINEKAAKKLRSTQTKGSSLGEEDKSAEPSEERSRKYAEIAASLQKYLSQLLSDTNGFEEQIQITPKEGLDSEYFELLRRHLTQYRDEIAEALEKEPFNLEEATSLLAFIWDTTLEYREDLSKVNAENAENVKIEEIEESFTSVFIPWLLTITDQLVERVQADSQLLTNLLSLLKVVYFLRETKFRVSYMVENQNVKLIQLELTNLAHNIFNWVAHERRITKYVLQALIKDVETIYGNLVRERNEGPHASSVVQPLLDKGGYFYNAEQTLKKY